MAQLMELKTISPDELHRLIEERSVAVVDVNSAQSWNATHVQGAKLLNPQTYEAGDLPMTPSPVLLKCRTRRPRPVGDRNGRARG